MKQISGFSKWLFTQVKEDSIFGDLARDAIKDPSWPKNGKTKEEFYKVVRGTAAESAFIEVWGMWEWDVAMAKKGLKLIDGQKE